MRSNKLTKKQLIEEFNVTFVSKDGDIYVNDKLRTQHVLRAKHEDGFDKFYKFVPVYSNFVNETYVYRGKEYTRKKQLNLLVHRAVYAWWSEAEECKENMTISHLDDDSFNNIFENLVEESLEENLARKQRTANQETKKYDYDVVLAYRRHIYANKTAAKHYKDQIDEFEEDLKSLKRCNRYISDYHERAMLKEDIAELKRQIAFYKAIWHSVCKDSYISLAEFAETYDASEE